MINLNMNFGDAHLRVARLALEAERYKEAWRVLPGDMRLAHRELTKFAEVQARVGRLRKEEREVARLHMGKVEEHHENVRRNATALRAQVGSHAQLAQYQQLLQSGGLTKAALRDPGLAELHGQHRALSNLDQQDAAMEQSRKFFGDNHATGDKTEGYYWANRAKDGAVQKLRQGQQLARTASNIFMGFQGVQLVNHSMEAYEQRAEMMQTLGSRLGGSFELVGKSLDAMREKFAYTRAQIAPAMEHLIRLLGKNDLISGVSAFALATGMSPADVAGHMGSMGQYGNVNTDFLERSMNASGFGTRPEAYLNMIGAAQGQLGQGFHTVPEDMAARYVAFISRAFGDQFKGERGQSVMGKLIGGIRGGGDGMSQALKMEAARRLGSIDLGGGIKLDTNTLWGSRGAMESGSPRYLEELAKTTREIFGKGELGKSQFANMSGLNVMETEKVWGDLGRNRGRLPTRKELESAPNLDDQRAVARQGPAYRHRQIAAGMEQDVHEKIGKELIPVAEDFKQAGLNLVRGLAKAENAQDALASWNSSMAAITKDAHSKLTEVVVLLNNVAQSDSLVGFAGRAAATHGAGRWDPGGATSKDGVIKNLLKEIGIDW
jgi:hypothetical protein